MIGDADLFVSFDNANPKFNAFEYQSRKMSPIDQIKLRELSDGYLNRPIFFSIFGNEKSEVSIKFSYEYKATYNEILQKSIQLADSQPNFQEIQDEKETRFYMYRPWWTGREKRSVVFIADMVFNKVFFFASWNHYPVHFRDSLHDKDDLIAIFPEDKDYHSRGGEYYIRLRPDFALYDMYSSRKYIFNMYAFAQAEYANNDEKENYYETMELG